MSYRSLESLPFIEALDLPNGISLASRLKLLLTIFRQDPSPKHIDEWKLKSAFLDFLKTSLSVVIPHEDIQIHRVQDLKKRKREDPVASGTLFVRDLGFLEKGKVKKIVGVDEDDDEKVLDERFLEWRRSVVNKMDGMELNVEGVKFQSRVEVPEGDDFDRVRQSLEEACLFGSHNRGYYLRGPWQNPDTLILEGVPSRWFAEPRVSSKPSMLVTHTILSVFGKIRNLNVAGGDDLGKVTSEAKDGAPLPGLQCKIWVQFEKREDFSNALRVLCGRSMQKQGSRLRADYKVSWDKEGFFRHSMQKKSRKVQLHEQVNTSNEVPKFQLEVARAGTDGHRPKRFRDY